ncbi:MAG: hypothetical protein Q7S16_01960 [bacterium]|nr:hypothetical protein [bacterium]
MQHNNIRALTITLSLLVVLGLSGAKAQAQFGPPAGFDPGAMMGQNGSGSFGPPAGMNFGPDGGPNQGQGFNPGSGMNGNGSGDEENFGPDEDQIQKMQLKGMFMGMKQGMRGMSQGIKMMKSMFPKLAKQGVTVPEELREAIVKAEEFIAYVGKIKSADDIEDPDAFMDRMSDMADVGSVLQEWGPRIGDLMRMGQMMKESDRQMKLMDAGVKKAKVLAAKSKVDLSNLITDLDANASAAKQALADAKAKTDPDEKQDALDTFFENVQNVNDTIKLINDLKNVGKAKTDLTRQVKQNDTLIKQLLKKKLDTSEIIAKQNELKAKLTELEQALKEKPIDQETVVGIFDEVKDLQAEFGDIRDTLTGTQSELPQIKADPYKSPALNFGAFEQFKKESPEPTEEAE